VALCGLVQRLVMGAKASSVSVFDHSAYSSLYSQVRGLLREMHITGPALGGGAAREGVPQGDDADS
jgi:hypothetical protein